MKYSFRSFVIIAFTALSVSAFAQKNKNVQTVVIKTQIYCDHCKICESCGGRILNDLYNVTGVKSTEVDPKTNTIKVTYDIKKITLEQLRIKISKLGFAADGVKADPAAVELLDDCCKKPS